jgi:hypothetical protein
MDKISWTDRGTNEEVIYGVREKRKIQQKEGRLI